MHSSDSESIGNMEDVLMGMLVVRRLFHRHLENGREVKGSETPYFPSYLSSGKPSGLVFLRHKLATHLGLRAKLRPRANASLSDLWVELPGEEEGEVDASLVRIRLQLPLIFVMLYTSSMSPKVYKCWISNLPPRFPSSILPQLQSSS